MSSISLDQISNRIRYESISKLANEVGKAESFEDLNHALKRNAKFIVSAYRYLFGFFIQNKVIEFDLLTDFHFRKNLLSRIFQESDEKPSIFLNNNKKDLIVNHFFEDSKVVAVAKVCRKEHNDGFIGYFGTKDSISYNYNDIKFIKLIGEILQPKIQSILLTEKIKLQNYDLQEANFQVELINKELTGSIQYAKMIQQALLPSEKSIIENFKNYFLFFLPRDGVSGDFYYSYKANGYEVIIAADCTGHGVPGAILSIFCIQILREVCRNVSNLRPDLILQEVDKKFREYLLLGISEEEKVLIKDGMDVSVVTVNKHNKKLWFSSAGRPFNYFSKRKEEQTDLKGSRFPIGNYFNYNKKNFDLHEIDFEKGDRFYIYSDGYADQFGGPLGKKYRIKKFKELLSSIQNLTIEKQGRIVREEFYNWKGHLPQIDDVLLIGVEL